MDLEYRADQYYRHAEMTAYLQAAADAFPQFVSLETIGITPEGRDIWVVTLTNRATGEPEDKPAYWIDANTHASEVTGNAAALYTIHYVTTRLQQPDIAQLLSERTLYIAPRLNPDGAEYCLEHNHYVRSARRLYPDPEPTVGLIEEDIDGDGYVLQMRLEADDGPWRPSAKDARLLVARMPWDTEGPFYHLYAEGTFEADALEDPRLPMLERDAHGLDFNRNYPNRWLPESDQAGAGPYPLSEPETRAAVNFLLAHRNVCGALTYHTYSGVLLRPFSDRPDTEMPPFDLAAFEAIGQRCEALTGYPCHSVFHDFRYDPVKNIGGAFDDWAYEQLGVHSYTMELWDPQNAAGVDPKAVLLDHWMKPTEDDLVKYLQWNDAELDGEGFEPWRPFEHPQLGRVDIGGWKFMYTLRNPPRKYLEKVCHDACLFSLDHARSGPRPRLSLAARQLTDGLWRLTATLANEGFLPTYVTERARAAQIAQKTHLEIELSQGLALEVGALHERVPHLDGMSNITLPQWPSHMHRGQTRDALAQRSWLLSGTGIARVTWRGDRVGRLEDEMELV